MDQDRPSTDQKALQINLDPLRHGTFAEIGAGQEVARWFFQVGGAAGTVAKTISAYDMAISDAIYGPSDRYVSRQRLRAMLTYEYDLLRERLDPKRGANTAFFSFANTVAAHSYTHQRVGSGWMGIRFQHAPRAEPSEIIMHVNLLDAENVREQQAIGILGVNLVYGAFYQHEDPPLLIASLMDDLVRERVEIDMIRFSGPCFAGVENRLMSLQLVQQGFAEVALFGADGEVMHPAELMYKKPILIERGSFRPITKLTQAIAESARAAFTAGSDDDNEPPVVVLELTLCELQTGEQVKHDDFLARVHTLGALGYPVMVSNYLRHHQLVPFLRKLTSRRLGFAMGLQRVRKVFGARLYEDIPGGILQAIGHWFQGDTKLYVCPAIDPETGQVVTASEFRVAPHLEHLYAHLLSNGLIQSINVPEELLSIYAREVIAKIQAGNPEWEAVVPEAVVALVKEHGYFGCPQPARSVANT